MARQLNFLLAMVLLCTATGCNFKMFDPGPGKAVLRECENDRNRISKELAEARTQRDLYRVEYEKIKTSEPQRLAESPMASSPADAQIRAARQQTETALAEARLARENLAGANARVNALEKQMIDLQQQSDKLRSSLAAESQQRAIAQEKAISADQANAQAASARAALEDLRKQLDAAIADKQKLMQEIETLRNR